jgi:multidrug resistance efflux pump
MTARRFWWRLGSIALLAALVGIGWNGGNRGARANLTDEIAASAPATAPSTSPSAQASPPGTSAVRRADLALSLSFDGTFEPADAFAVRPHTRRYQGDFIIKKAVAPSTKVAKGDMLLALETDDVDVQIAAVENELKAAQANLAKAQADVKLGQEGDDLAMSAAKDSKNNSQTELKRWDTIDGATFALAAGIEAKIGDYQVESASDELDQLHKMYKSEDLTSETADIVVKRAIRVLGIYKLMNQVSHVVADRVIQFEAGVRRQQLASVASQQTLSVSQLEAAQTQGQILRETGLVTAKAAVDDAVRRLEELKHDREAFTIDSPIDGVVVYGAFAHKLWQEVDPDHLAPGEKVTADQIVMTVYTPGKLRLVAECPEAQVTLLSPGDKMKVNPTALSDVTYEATCDTLPTIGEIKGSQQLFDIVANLPPVDARLAPGFGADVSFDAGTLHNVLLVPQTAVWKNWVWVVNPGEKNPADNAQKRQVVVGRSDGQDLEIKSGLNEGELVLTQAKRPGQ